GDQLYFYVSGRGKGRVTSLATLRRDGFASIDGDFFGGTLTTRPVRFSGKHFFVNLDAPSGGVWIEVFGENGRLLLTSDRIKGDKRGRADGNRLERWPRHARPSANKQDGACPEGVEDQQRNPCASVSICGFFLLWSRLLPWTGPSALHLLRAGHHADPPALL